MKITIDTKHDSHDEIKHAIQILNSILERQGVSQSPRPAESVDSTNMMSMFGGTPETTPTAAPTPTTEQPASPMSMFAGSSPQPTQDTTHKDVADTPPDFSSFINLAERGTENKEEGQPKVEYF